jgi:hypothetical protein
MNFYRGAKHDRERRRQQKRELKIERLAIRRAMKDNTAAHVSADHPTLALADRQPPIPAALAHAIGAEMIGR